MTFLKSCFCSASLLFVLSQNAAIGADEIIQTAATTSSTNSPSEAIAIAALNTVPATNAPFTPLITGTDLQGWVVQEGKTSAWKREGEVISCLSSSGGWLRTEAEYSDFVVRLEYRLQAGGNTGVGIRAPATGNPTFTGLEIQLLDDSSPKYADLRLDQYTGSVYYQVPATQKAKLKPLNEWNQCEILCLGDELTVKINGEIVNQIQLTKRHVAATSGKPTSHLLSERPPLGHLALQSHSTRVDFRNVEVQDLTVRTPTGLKYVDLHAGNGEEVGNAKTVTMHYVGQLSTGKRFTDTRDVGSPVTVPAGSLIPGLLEGIQTMKVNGRRRIIVPASLGYGSVGVNDTIPADSTLVFEVEIVAVAR